MITILYIVYIYINSVEKTTNSLNNRFFFAAFVSLVDFQIGMKGKQRNIRRCNFASNYYDNKFLIKFRINV